MSSDNEPVPTIQRRTKSPRAAMRKKSEDSIESDVVSAKPRLEKKKSPTELSKSTSSRPKKLPNKEIEACDESKIKTAPAGLERRANLKETEGRISSKTLPHKAGSLLEEDSTLSNQKDEASTSTPASLASSK